jgi:hypothetical protein
MEDYSAMKSCPRKSNLYYFTFSLDSDKSMKAVIHNLPPDMPVEVISNSLEDIGFTIIDMRQMTATQTVPNGQTHIEHPLYSMLP